MWFIILALLVLGVALMVIEGFVPGMIIGIAGGVAVVVATVLAYMHYGTGVGNLLLLGVLIGGAVFTIWWLRYAPRSEFARRWTLHSTVEASQQDIEPTVLGLVGEALSPLRPSGIAEIAGRRLDVVTEGDLVASGARVRVIKVEGNRIVVRKLDSQPEVSA